MKRQRCILMTHVMVLSVMLQSGWASCGPGRLPTGEFSVSPSKKDGDVFLVLAGDTLSFSVSQKEDKDCECKLLKDDVIEDPAGVKFTATAGSVSPSTGSSVTFTAPTSGGTVSIGLQINDKGDIYNDGSFQEVTSKQVKAQVPTTLEFVKSTKLPGGAGGKYDFKVSDQNGKAMKSESSIKLIETYPQTAVEYLVDDNKYAEDSIPGGTDATASSTGTNSEGIISDTPVNAGTPGSVKDVVESIYQQHPLHPKCNKVKRVINNHAYKIKYGSTQTLTGVLLTQSQEIELAITWKQDENGQWIVDSVETAKVSP
jgi:hypothetical protein